jgi:hypothetical protein
MNVFWERASRATLKTKGDPAAARPPLFLMIEDRESKIEHYAPQFPILNLQFSIFKNHFTSTSFFLRGEKRRASGEG